MKPSSDESPRKASTQKKIAAQRKASSSTTRIWPCSIDGCNKLFAREADLKRHQRTTKVHSTPGFACPQCDATFTRTDALRRHQKSRHNGVVIEPTEPEADNDNCVPSTPRSRNRSFLLSNKNKVQLAPLNTTPLSPQAGTSAPASGTTSYYRPHTSFASPHPTDTCYVSTASPSTSTTRLHQAQWPPPPPWEGNSPHLNPPLGSPTPFRPSPYYRSNASPNEIRDIDPSLTSQPRAMHGRGSPEAESVLRVENSRSTTPHGSDRSGSLHSQSQSPIGSGPAPPVIDPSLDELSSTARPPGISIEVTQAAMRALIKSSKHSSSATSSHHSASPVASDAGPLTALTQPLREADEDAGMDMGYRGSDAPASVSLDRDNGMDDALERPPSMEHMLTEDGEPMLNPAEILRMESLASPPPS